MATYMARGNTHNIVYPYRTDTGERKQQWESYTTELEAIQRKAYIDYLQKNRLHDELLKAVTDYKGKRAAERAVEELARNGKGTEEILTPSGEDNTNKTYREFTEKWLPFHARKKRFSPNSYDSYSANLKNHILPVFGDRIMSTITSEEIDDFIDYLSNKPCMGSKSYNKDISDIPMLSSSSVKKCYNILTAGFPTAKKWHYITEIPDTTAPAEKMKKRKAWKPEQVNSFLNGIKEDKMLHLAVHIAFVCSLREGETAGIDLNTVDFYDRSLRITQQVQRVSDEALQELPKGEIIRVFPKQHENTKSSLILKTPKTEGSIRKQYLPGPLLQEIRKRIDEIKHNKEFFGDSYQDCGLLICHSDGSPIDPKNLDKEFKEWQKTLKIDDKIEFQGLRKSGQMHKVRLTNNNYLLVAETGGQTAPVLMDHYDEPLESEKRNLAHLVEEDFYHQGKTDNMVPPSNENTDSATTIPSSNKTDAVVQAMREDPEFSKKVLQAMQDDPELSRKFFQMATSRAVSADDTPQGTNF